MMQSVFDPAGPDAAIISQLGWVMTAGSALLLALVLVLLGLALRHGPEPVSTRRWVVLAGVALPVSVLTALLAFSTWRSSQLVAQTSRDALHIAVTAKMWWWEVRYRDPASGRDIVLANEIRIPVGRRVYLGLSSSDVIHSVWVPSLAGKVDTIPGRMNGLALMADRPGVYRGQCAEYCGAQHAKMALHVVAHEPQRFAAWLANQSRPAAAPSNALLERGRQAFLDHRCGACHTIRGVTNGSPLGPDLTHVGSRLHIAAGTLRTQHGALAGWIANPQSSKPGALMPAASGMDGETLRALAAYLEHLK